MYIFSVLRKAFDDLHASIGMQGPWGFEAAEGNAYRIFHVARKFNDVACK
jgi:hypothetical protein